VTVSHQLGTWTGQLVNISTGGVLVEIAELRAGSEAGDDCSVFIRLEDSQLLITATLVRVSAGQPGRIAMQWASGDVSVIKKLAALIETLDPELV
jgi:hypothetical protein